MYATADPYKLGCFSQKGLVDTAIVYNCLIIENYDMLVYVFMPNFCSSYRYLIVYLCCFLIKAYQTNDAIIIITRVAIYIASLRKILLLLLLLQACGLHNHLQNQGI